MEYGTHYLNFWEWANRTNYLCSIHFWKQTVSHLKHPCPIQTWFGDLKSRNALQTRQLVLLSFAGWIPNILLPRLVYTNDSQQWHHTVALPRSVSSHVFLLSGIILPSWCCLASTLWLLLKLLRVRLAVILESVSSLFNTSNFLSFKYKKD